MRGAEGKALHKPEVGEAKSTKHKLLTTKACNKLREPKGEHCSKSKKLLNKAKLSTSMQ